MGAMSIRHKYDFERVVQNRQNPPISFRQSCVIHILVTFAYCVHLKFRDEAQTQSLLKQIDMVIVTKNGDHRFSSTVRIKN